MFASRSRSMPTTPPLPQPTNIVPPAQLPQLDPRTLAERLGHVQAHLLGPVWESLVSSSRVTNPGAPRATLRNRTARRSENRTVSGCIFSILRVRRQPFLNCQPSVSSHQSLVTSHQPSLITHQSSVITHQSTLISHHSSHVAPHNSLSIHHPPPKQQHIHSSTQTTRNTYN